jgi:cysteinyl-tRNA synthetase
MCGPTVYDHSHLGHARTYIGFDTIKKIMRDYFKYDIELCMNITDIDDKIINRSNELKMDFNLFKQKWEDAFLEDMKNLNVELPEIMTRVTEYIPEIITFIEKVISNKFAYESNNSVYFDVSAYKKDGRFLYGILEPGLCNNEDLLKEGEGSLSSN